MATSLRHPMGYVFLDNNGNPAASGTINFFRAGTTTAQDVFSDAAEASALNNPITLNAAGRAVDGSNALVAIYLSDNDGFDYKEVVALSSGTVLWTDDDIPSPVDLTASLSDTAKPRIQWSTDTAASVSLTAGMLGGGRLASSGSNSITYPAIAASAAGNGNGYLIKKTSASNTVTFDPNGSDTVDGAATFAWTADDEAYWFISDGANWQVAPAYRTNAGIFPGVNALTEDTAPDPDADFLLAYDTSASAPKKVKPRNLSLITQAASQATTSGTFFDFTGIGSVAKRITVMFVDVSLSGTEDILVQIGGSGGIESSGYVSTCCQVGGSSTVSSSTAGFIIDNDNAARIISGHMTLTRIDTLTWVASFVTKFNTASLGAVGAGSKTVSTTLDKVRITRTGADTFDNGLVSIIWE